ncbi:multiple sugar transport system substrate-binding protein [Pullulanibacillus pueri]|uniref:ABC transporter substrate-binding protein n=1 Tax=Pullulanibacillus pueri TaxID=1437324 RepID=A0A8J2ZY88_9BACL|nr:ABC transporter substrate-binding protein [Pullulanibacillus pueri]MBM7683306.1 multiple sugar transport system substrate-binding protein [Pullulanibacillus pueri]GGH86445.1 ABC transporter substrate-binding protein [Pullulanibacillus pueri]
MRRFIRVFLFITLVLLVLNACSSGSSGTKGKSHSDKKITVTAWHGAGGEGGKFLQSLVKEYNSQQDKVEVKLQYVSTDNMVQKITAAAAGNALPDMGLLMWPQWTGPLKDIIQPLDDFIKEDPDKWNEDDFLDSLLDGNVRFNDVTYGFPMETNNLALYYNKKLFKEAGVEPPKTWDDLVTVAKKLTNPAKKQWGIELPTEGNGHMDFIWDNFLWQAGGEYANEKGTDLLFNNEAGVKATQFWTDLINKYKVASISPPQNGFQSGKIAMSIDGPYDIPNLKSAKVDFGIVPLPEGPGGKATSLGGTNNLIFKSTSEKEKASWDFLTWLASPEVTAKFAAGYGSIPVRKSSSEEKVWQDFIKENPGVQVHVDAYKYGKIRPYNLSSYDQISQVVASHVQAALYKKETPEEAIKKAYQESKPLVKSWLTN